MTKAHFISFEGIDNCGKSTHVQKLEDYLKKHNIPVVTARDPGSTALGGALRMLIKHPQRSYAILNEAYKTHHDFSQLSYDEKRTAEAELLMFLAARAEFVEHIVQPNLAQGISVIADRYADSTRAYQGGGRYKSRADRIELINNLNKFAIKDIWPDLTFLLDIPYEEMLTRAQQDELDFMESLGKEFFDATRAEYKTIAREQPDRFVLIDGMKPIEAIAQEDIVPYMHWLYKF